MNKRKAKKIYNGYRVKGPRGSRGPGHRFDTIQRAWSKWLSVLSRRYGRKVGFRLFCENDELCVCLEDRPQDYRIGGHHGKET